MKVINLGESNSVLNSFVAQMRDRKIQKNSLLFRTNLHRVGEIFAYDDGTSVVDHLSDETVPVGLCAALGYIEVGAFRFRRAGELS